MKYSINIKHWYAIAPGLESIQAWNDWSQQVDYDYSQSLPILQKIPMMSSRRMSIPSRLAVEVGLNLIDAMLDISLDAAVFISRHGELERSSKILIDINKNLDISPTDFAMSVHNTAAGLLTIWQVNLSL